MERAWREGRASERGETKGRQRQGREAVDSRTQGQGLGGVRAEGMSRTGQMGR